MLSGLKAYGPPFALFESPLRSFCEAPSVQVNIGSEPCHLDHVGKSPKIIVNVVISGHGIQGFFHALLREFGRFESIQTQTNPSLSRFPHHQERWFYILQELDGIPNVNIDVNRSRYSIPELRLLPIS